MKRNTREKERQLVNWEAKKTRKLADIFDKSSKQGVKQGSRKTRNEGRQEDKERKVQSIKQEKKRQ